ncbi:hypothetical protein JCM19233_865 [Vibrio astriarenae]|nr:hypothetical protein JCM19233_865 [Vibrio sp. C7]
MPEPQSGQYEIIKLLALNLIIHNFMPIQYFDGVCFCHPTELDSKNDISILHEMGLCSVNKLGL